MKQSLTILSLLCCAASASAQVKIPAAGQSQTPPKQAMTAPVYVPPPPGTQLLVVGGSDDCSNAAANDAISGAGTFSMTNVGATNGLPDSTGCVNTQLDVWFYWTSTQTGTARLQFCGQTTTDTVVAIWADNNGGACPSGTAVVCNDDSCGLQSQVLWSTTAGQTYFLQLGAFGAEFMQAPVRVRDRRLGLAQLVGRVGLRFLGGGHLAAQVFDAAFQVLQLPLLRIDRRREGGRRQKRDKAKGFDAETASGNHVLALP